ncbi:MAG: universal stress protein [Deltaproteobacteria bacterium]|nr:universal stress protein [Candidatus Anaeroferrophillus wilburensis]MBN2889706.1 universal stress protein [Deltaproteobacteria bacterium]
MNMKNETPEDQPVKRILVMLDPSAPGRRALRAAAGIAADLQAELLGLLVEDMNLFRLASLPFTREINLFTGSKEDFPPSSLAQGLQAQAERLRRNLAAAAQQRQVSWSFRVTRGEIVAEVMTVMPQVDILIIGRPRQSLPSRLRLTSHDLGRRSGSQQERPKAAGHYPVMAYFNGSPSSLRGMDTAGLLARDNGGSLRIILPLGNQPLLKELEQQVLQWMRQRHLKARLIYLAEVTIEKVVHLVNREHGSALVLGRDTFDLDQGSFSELLDLLPCPVVLVN